MTVNSSEPIVAIATAPGNSGIGIIRLSGEDATLKSIVSRLVRDDKFEPRKVVLKKLFTPAGEQIDRALIIYFPAPFSYTGETVIEIQAHGGQVLLTWLMEMLEEIGKDQGLRLANPGEFTERAFLNGKMDIVQAEAVADIIDASSRNALRAASLSLKGEFSKKIHELADELIHLRVEVEAILDFPEEEIDFVSEYKCQQRTEELLAALNNILDTAQQGVALREGFRAAIVGQTNVGKSSLLNQLAGEDIAIVSAVEGTTRDKIQTQILINGIPFFIIDTAGIRDTGDEVEKIGIDRAKKEISTADIILHVTEATSALASQEDEKDRKVIQLIESLTHPDIPVITVRNKADLIERRDSKNVSRETEVFTSAVTGEGIESLKKILLKTAGWKDKESVFIARERHVRSLKEARSHLEKALFLISSSDQPLELYAEELRLAADKLGEIVGKTLPDDLLGMIFSGFCIGK
ncbi:MAG: tRNA uridine-5-carboxymethylaminomethyl(34) synthesis GTPase MnmE [Burkholderiales bacterium]|nr:tRNA uridine-5-carboxymethylaminomethyl(34) synthesis GTPase MnmE [Burkholderiales bacterium]